MSINPGQNARCFERLGTRVLAKWRQVRVTRSLRSPASNERTKVHVFVSFDLEDGEDLYELRVAQSRTPSSGFAVLRSINAYLAKGSMQRPIRRRIR